MSDYKPSSIVAKLAEKMRAVPVAESIKLDGTVVIIFEDGRKIIFDKDAITRTLTEPAIAFGQGGVMPPLPTSTARDAEANSSLDDVDSTLEKPRLKRKKGTS